MEAAARRERANTENFFMTDPFVWVKNRLYIRWLATIQICDDSHPVETGCCIEGINAEYNMTKMSFVNKMCHSWIRGKIKGGTRLVKQNVSGWISLCRFKNGLPRVLSAPLAREKRGTAPY